jgi:putative inorganic carbon (HCO3(-)) transporter
VDRAFAPLILVLAGAAAALAGWAMVAVHPALPVAAIAAVALGLWLISSPLAMLIGFMGILFVRPAELVPALEPLMLGKLTMVGALAYFVLTKLVRRELSIASSGLNFFVIWLAVAAAISGVLGTHPTISQAMFTEVFVKILVLYGLIVNLADSPKRAIVLQVAIALLVAFIAVYTLYMKATSEVLVEGTRAAGIGMLGDPNDTALTFLMVTPFLLAAALDCRGLARVGFWLLFLLMLAGIIATQSRGGILGLGAGLFVLLRQRIRNRTILYGSVAVVLVAFAVVAGVSKRQGLENEGLDESAEGRLIAWKAGMRMFRANPVFGIGYETFPYNFLSYAESIPFDKRSMTAHNSYVLCIAEVGLFGSIPFFMLLGGAALTMHRVAGGARDRPRSLERALMQGSLANLAAVATSAFFLSQTWMWFIHILFAQSAALGRVYGVRFEPGRAILSLFSPRRRGKTRIVGERIE